jgi:hypothetical protein
MEDREPTEADLEYYTFNVMPDRTGRLIARMQTYHLVGADRRPYGVTSLDLPLRVGHLTGITCVQRYVRISGAICEALIDRAEDLRKPPLA